MTGDQDSLPERLRWLVEDGCCITCDKRLCDMAADEIDQLRAELQAFRDGNLAESTIRVLRDAIRRLRNAGDALEQRLAEHGDPDDFQAREMWAAANIGLPAG